MVPVSIDCSPWKQLFLAIFLPDVAATGADVIGDLILPVNNLLVVMPQDSAQNPESKGSIKVEDKSQRAKKQQYYRHDEKRIQ